MSPVLHPTLPPRGNERTKPARKSLLQDAKALLELKAKRAERSGPATEAANRLPTRREESHEASPILGAEFDPPYVSGLEELVRDKSINKPVISQVFSTLERQGRQSNKENIDTTSRPKAFIERQDDAERVPWNDGCEEGSSGNSRKVLVTKRRRGPTESDGAEDDEFETIASGAADKRRREARDKTGRSRVSSKPFRSEALQPVHSARGSNDQEDDESSDEHRAGNRQPGTSPAISSSMRASQRPPPSSHPARYDPRSGQNTHTPPISSAPMSTGEQLDRVREQARQRVVTIKPSRVQSRTSYNEYEEERLINLIEEHGISYSLIKQIDEQHEDGPLLLERSQVQLKDKAQELKFQFLKAQAGLPINFDKIPLRKRMRDQLEALGIFSDY